MWIVITLAITKIKNIKFYIFFSFLNPTAEQICWLSLQWRNVCSKHWHLSPVLSSELCVRVFLKFVFSNKCSSLGKTEKLSRKLSWKTIFSESEVRLDRSTHIVEINNARTVTLQSHILPGILTMSDETSLTLCQLNSHHV